MNRNLRPKLIHDATLDLLTKTTGAVAAIAHVRKIAALTGPGKAAA
jgi:hypothetical protein